MSGLDVEGVLAGHRLHPSMNICTGCDWRATAGVGDLWTQHAAHVAAVLREQVAAAQAEAWDEGHENSDCSACRYYDTDHNPYRAAQVAPSRVPGEES